MGGRDWLFIHRRDVLPFSDIDRIRSGILSRPIRPITSSLGTGVNSDVGRSDVLH